MHTHTETQQVTYKKTKFKSQAVNTKCLLFYFNENFKFWDNYRCTCGGKINAETYQLPFIHFPLIVTNILWNKNNSITSEMLTLTQSTYRTLPSPIGSLTLLYYTHFFPVGSDGKESAYNEGDLGLTTGLKRLPWRRQFLATHSSILAWRIPCTEKPGEAPSVGSVQRVGHDWATFTFFHFFHFPF